MPRNEDNSEALNRFGNNEEHELIQSDLDVWMDEEQGSESDTDLGIYLGDGIYL